MRRLLRRPSHATVVAYLALFFALGGSAMAAFVVSSNSQIGPGTIYGANKPANANDNIVDGSITANDIKPNSIGAQRITDNSLTGADFADGSVSGDKLAKGSVPPGKLPNDSLTGTQINESTLGAVPAAISAASADKLDRLDSSAFVQGRGEVEAIDASIDSGNSATVLDIPGFIRMDYFCEGRNTPGQYGLATGNNAVSEFADNGGADPEHRILDANNSIGSSLWETNPAGDSYTWSFESAGRVATVNLSSFAFRNIFTRLDVCNVQGTAVVHDA